jgi:hypothetical protein
LGNPEILLIEASARWRGFKTTSAISRELDILRTGAPRPAGFGFALRVFAVGATKLATTPTRR